MPLIIPHDQINENTLLGIIKAYVLSEGTDYGQVEYDIDTKIKRVMDQLKSSKAFVAYDEAEETATIVTAEKAIKLGISTKA